MDNDNILSYLSTVPVLAQASTTVTKFGTVIRARPLFIYFIYLFTSCCIKVTVNYKFTITSDLTTGRITEKLFHSSSGDPRITKLILGDILVKQIKNSSMIEHIIICEVLEKT